MVIGKIIVGSSFAATVGYVMKEQSRVLVAEGVEPLKVADMVRDFKDQTLLNSRIKNAVGHISLSFSTKDAGKLTDPLMAQIAREYMERMGIRNTQYLLVRHTDQAHPHCHIVYNRIGNDGQTISDKNIKLRNGKICKELTAKYGLYYPQGKEQVLRERLREPDKIKYAIYDAIRSCLRGCRSWGDLEKRLQEQGITTTFKYCGNTDRKQGVLFSKNGHTFSGSKIDRAFSFSKLDRCFSQMQHREMLVCDLGKVAGNYRSALEGLFGGIGGKMPSNTPSVDLGGNLGAIPLPPKDSSVGLSASQLQRRQGESPEEHIARITALLREAEEAMLTAAEGRKRKLRDRKINTPKMRF